MIRAQAMALREAERLGHQWVGAEHILLGILGAGPDDVAVAAMAELEVTHESFECDLLAGLLHGEPSVRSAWPQQPTQPAPRYYLMDGWVSGYCAALGVPPSNAVLLLALCSSSGSRFPGTVSPEQIVDALRRRGIDIPDGLIQPPSQIEVDMAASVRIDVPLEHLGRVHRQLMEARLLVAFNVDRDNDQAWVRVKPEHEAAVSELLAGAAAE
ncbi:MAG: Clp protease N-terminal domain-containing protein [Acidimicrobiales bacterium]